MTGYFVKKAKHAIAACALFSSLATSHANFQILENFEGYLSGLGSWQALSSNGLGVTLDLSTILPIEGTKQMNVASLGVHLLGDKQTVFNTNLNLNVDPLAETFSFKYLDLLNVSLAKKVQVSFVDGLDGEVYLSEPIDLPPISLGTIRNIRIPLGNFNIVDKLTNGKLDKVKEVKLDFITNVLSVNLKSNIDILGFELGVDTNATDLAVTKTGPASVAQNSNFEYNLVVTNNGPNAASGTIVEDDLPAGTTYVSALTDLGSVVHNNGTVTANIGTLPAGESKTVRITVNAATVGTVQNTATVTYTGSDTDPANNTSNIVSTIISQAGGSNSAPVNTVPGAQSVSISQALAFSGDKVISVADGDDDPVSVNLTVNQGTLTIGNASGATVSGPNTNLTLSGSVATVNAALATLSFNAPAAAGSAILTVSTSDGTAADVDVITITVTDPNAPGPLEPTDLAVTKTPSVTSSAPGTSVTYTITYENKGSVAAENVEIVDNVPAGTSIIGVTGSISGSLDVTGNRMIVNFDSMPAGLKETAYLTVRFAHDASGVINNTVNIDADNLDSVPTNNSATAPVTVAARPSDCGYDYDANWPQTTSIHTIKNSKKGVQSKVKFGGPIFISNTGALKTPKSLLRYYLSDDEYLDPTDLVVGTKTVGPIKPAKSKKVKVKAKIPVGINASGKYLLVVMGAQSGGNDPCVAFNRILISSQIPQVGK